MNINRRTTRPRNHRELLRRLNKPGTCHMLRDGRILTTAETRREIIKRYWGEASEEESRG